MPRTRPPLAPLVLLAAFALVPGWVAQAGCAAGSDAPPDQTPTEGAEAGGTDGEPLPARAFDLHTRGFAALENEQPVDAEEAYRELTGVAPADPLPWANLAVAQLRQQKTEEALASVGEALERVEEGSAAAGAVHAIQGAVLDWVGRSEDALAAYRAAAEAAPEDPEILYSLYRQSETLGETETADGALDRLIAVRPDNFVVLVERGKRAVRAGDRAAATEVYLRIRELLWQAPPVATTAMEGALEALEAASPDDLSGVRVPSARLENVLKITPMYRESLRELSTGIQAVPLRRFAAEGEDAAAGLGEPLAVRFAGARLSEAPTAGAALAVADLDGDGATDVARIVETGEGRHLELRLGDGTEASVTAAGVGGEGPAPAGLLAADLWNDGAVDLLAYGPEGSTLWSGGAAETDGIGARLQRPPQDSAEAAGLAKIRAVAMTAVDYDIEADLDLVTLGPGGIGLYRNSLEEEPGSPMASEGARVFPGVEIPEGARAVTWSDLDRDGDPDLLVAGDFGLRLLDNLRNGTFADRTADAGLGETRALADVTTADLDGDGLPDIAAAGPGGLWLATNRTGNGRPTRFEAWGPSGLPDAAGGELRAIAVFDADNDGRLDLALAGPAGVLVLGRDGAGGFVSREVEGGPGRSGGATALAAADLDGDGDLDLVAAGPEGLHRLTNEGGNRNHWLSVRLRGLTQGNGKNNVNGVGATVEVIDGRSRQLREHDGRVSHFGLGSREAADVLRVVWNNGVPQNRIGVAGDQTITEEQVLKGSCPFLYTWDGERVAFVTDLLWGAPVGLPVAEGIWVPADSSELVEVTGARPLPDESGKPGIYDLRVTEELWEAAYFDAVRLWVVDHPEEVSVASNLRIVPGVHPSEPPYTPDRILGSRDVRPVADAVDGRGRDVTARVAARDHVYADGYEAGLYQGLAREPWSFGFTLTGEELPTGEGVRLLLDGWIFPTDASINIALSQNRELGIESPRLEVATAAGWRTLMPNMGHPAGKTKTLVVDTPPLPDGAVVDGTVKLRIVTNQWISWDRIAWSPRPADEEPTVVARLAPERADLRFRGFSKLVRRAPNAPHEFDYTRTSTSSPWGASPGPYTRFGDVRELLAEPDSRPVVLGPGDEIALRFDTSHLPPPAPGHRRTLFLESHGWDKDYDKHTWAVDSGSLPLPFQGMTVYPWSDDAEPPPAEDQERFRREWLTREDPGPER